MSLPHLILLKGVCSMSFFLNVHTTVEHVSNLSINTVLLMEYCTMKSRFLYMAFKSLFSHLPFFLLICLAFHIWVTQLYLFISLLHILPVLLVCIFMVALLLLVLLPGNHSSFLTTLFMTFFQQIIFPQIRLDVPLCTLRRTL